MACGIALGAVGAAGMLLVGTDTPYTMLLPTLLGVGTGCGLLTTAVVAAAVRSVPAAQSGLASGVNNAMRQTGTAAGVAVFGAVAGSPEHVGAFVAGWHHLAWAALGIWGVAMALALLATAAPRAKSVAGQMSGAPS
jgi:DHA2 family methylenomycin A resistance protein-like MFS transporter